MNSNEFTRHSDLWFDDGSVVLVAQGTGFRVHRGLLARHSGIFHDTFSMPQPVDVEMYENRQVVRLMEDSAADWSTILGILYDCGQKFFNAVEQIEFRVVAAALELGTKYAFDAMRGEALRRLSHCCPRDLEAVSDEDKPHCSHRGHSVKTGCSIIWCEDSMTDPILAFRLARRLGLDDLIPMALYYCVKEADLSEILSSLSNQDGSFSKSSTQELVAFIHAHEYLSIRQVDIYENFSTYKPSPHCANKDLHETFEGPCHKAKDSCASHTLFHHVFRRRDVFYPMDSYVEDMGGEYCEPCSLYYKETIFKQQKEAWAYLRARFGSSSVPAERHELDAAAEDMIA